MRIAQLYKEGKRFTAWPLRVTYMPIAKSQEPIANSQILVWAPKSLFKRAVKRNHLRRLMREATINKAICKALKKIAEK